VTEHAWAYGGTIDDGGDRVRVRRCERCGCTDRMPMARQSCPSVLDHGSNERAREAYITEHGEAAWYARHYEIRARYRAKKAAERQKAGE
jgi:hypothetical protein